MRRLRTAHASLTPQVDVSTRSLEYVFQLHEAPINTVLLSAGFAVTGSADRTLRVWPLDFASHFLEARAHRACAAASHTTSTAASHTDNAAASHTDR